MSASAAGSDRRRPGPVDLPGWATLAAEVPATPDAEALTAARAGGAGRVAAAGHRPAGITKRNELAGTRTQDHLPDRTRGPAGSRPAPRCGQAPASQAVPAPAAVDPPQA